MTPNPTTATRSQDVRQIVGAPVLASLHLCEREIRVTLRTVAAGVFGGCHGRLLRELSKGDVTDGGCGGLRRVSRPVAAGALEG